MEAYYRDCIKDYTYHDQENGLTLKLKAGKEYLTSRIKNGVVTVFTGVWAYGIDAKLFDGRRKL